MKRRTALMLGFAIGYVLGAKAGRERYEQIRRAAKLVANNPPIRRLIDDVSDLADAGTTSTRTVLSEQLHNASASLKRQTG